MKTKIIHITENNTDQISYESFQRLSNLDDSNKRDKLKIILHKIIQNELTDKQRMCLLLHYYKGMKMKDIALKLGLCNSTVSRHIASATKKLKNIAQYYM